MKAVVDSNVIISGLINQSGPPGIILKKGMNQEFEMVASPLLLDEIEGVMRREWFVSHYLSDHQEFLESFRQHAKLYLDEPRDYAVLPSDSDDVFLLDLAISTSSLLVTGDHALSALAGSLPVLTPRSFLNLLDATEENLQDCLPGQLTLDRFAALVAEARKQTLRENSKTEREMS